VRAAADSVAYGRFFHELLDRGVAFAPGSYEVLFPGLAHEQAHLDSAVAAAGEAARAVTTGWG
ncbi:MAG: hypothetical protein ACRDVW_02150, partial [Acidimicrobiales bacterium]